MPVKEQAQPLSRRGSRAGPKTRQHSATKTGRGFHPMMTLNETHDEEAETEPLASNVRNVRRLTYVKRVSEVRQSPKKLHVPKKTTRKNILQKPVPESRQSPQKKKVAKKTSRKDIPQKPVPEGRQSPKKSQVAKKPSRTNIPRKPVPEGRQSPKKSQVAKKTSRENIPQKPVPEGRQSPKKLKVAKKMSRKNIPQKVGRRTGTAAFEGKNIRLLPDGTENFDDYWTDSEAEISSSRESILKEKKSTFNKPSNFVQRKKLSMSPKKVAETVRYSTAPKIGRRTGVAAFEGKKIRLLPDGTENFDDYFTDSEAEISSSGESVLKEKKSTFNKPSNVVRREPSIPPKKVAETVSYSTAPKIGRRTGVAAFESKKIRLLPDGTENFDDYFTDTTTTDSYLMEPSQRKSSIPLKSHLQSKRNKSNNVYNERPGTRDIAEPDALVSTDDEAPIISAADAAEAIQVPISTRNSKKKNGKADAKKGKNSNKKKQKDKLPSTEGVRRGTRIRIPPLESWRGQRQVYKYKSGEGFVYANISPGRNEDNACRQAILKRMQQQKEMKVKEKKKGKSRHIPETTVFDAFNEKEVKVHLHQPFDCVEWKAILKGAKVPYYLAKTFISDKVKFGFLKMCPLEMRANQCSPWENTHFLVVKGSVKVLINKSEFTFERLDTFIVPRHQAYSIENVVKTTALLFFCAFKTPFFPHQNSTNQQE